MNKIRELRKEKGLTQLQFCQKLNITQSTLSGWECGRWQPDNETLIKLADYFNVSIDYLLGRENINQKATSIINVKLEYWKEIKKRKKITIEEIAKKANLPKGSVQNIFAGYVPDPRIDTVEAIERALGISNGISDTLLFWLQRKKSLKLTNRDIANLSNVPLSTIEQIMCGKIKSPRLDTVEAIERALGISNGIKDEVEINDYFPIPLLGSVVAGVPIESQENTEGYVYISFRPKQEYFALRVHGESMINAGIKDKSVLIVHKQEMAENGDIIVAMLNKEQTVKRFKQVGNTVFLMPENPTFDPIPVTPTDELIILGKVVEVRIAL